MRASTFFLLTCSAGLLFAAGCGSTTPSTTQSSSTTPPSANSASAFAKNPAIESLTVSGLPGFSSSTHLQVIRLGERLNARLYDAGQKRELVTVGVGNTSADYEIPLYTDVGDSLGSISATQTSLGVFAGNFISAKGHVTHLQIQQDQPRSAFEVVSVKKMFPANAGDNYGCLFEVSYPQLTADSGISEAIRATVNAEIASSSRPMLLIEDGAAHPKTLDEAATAYVSDCQQTREDMQKMMASDSSDTAAATDNLSDVAPWDFSQTFDIPLYDKDILSIMTASEEYSGGAHGNHVFSFLNFDLKTGKRLTVGDVIATNSLKAFFQQEKRQLLQLNEQEQLLFDENATAFKTFVADRSAQTAADAREFGAFDSFYLSHDRIVTLYNEYDIAPYSSGPQSAELPYLSIKSLLGTNSVIKRLME